MKKKQIIFVAVVIALWAGFMVFRHFKTKGDIEEHHGEEHARITQAAKTSPRAGLAQMGSALQRYHDDNKTYPPSLNELYPKYVGSKAFIDELDWYYTRQGDNFFLSKTVVRDNARMVASMDKSLMAHVETGTMVATPTPTLAPAEVKAPEVPIAGAPEVSVQSREEFWEALRRRELGKAVRPFPQKRTSAILLARRPKIISVVEPDIVSEAERQVSERYLVWKDENGTLGFGDAQFPATNSRRIFDEGNWYDVTIPIPGEMMVAGRVTKPAGTAVDHEKMFAQMGDGYLVWKGEQGTLGFGNIEYPEKDHLAVFADNDWVNVETPSSVAKTVGENKYVASREKTAQAIASALSNEHLVWKEHGVLGFGNVVYPRSGQVSAYEGDGWVGVESPALVRGTDLEREYAAAEDPLPDEVASEISMRYLVWKDEQGNLGFGNVVYPRKKGVSHVRVEGRWEKITN